MTTPVTLIPGDGIGPSITDATVRILEAAGARRRVGPAGRRYRRRQPLGRPDARRHARLHQARRSVALKGPLETPVGEGYRSVNVALRKTFDLYANVRPARTLIPGGRFEDVDLVLVRENTEGLYIGHEHYMKHRRRSARGGGIDRGDHALRLRAHRALRLRVRAHARPQEGHARAQGQHPQVLAGALPRHGPHGGAGVRGARAVRGPHHRRHGHAPRDASRAVRRGRDHEPVRRHPLRPDLRPGGRPRHDAGRQHRQQRRDLRGGARHRPRHRGEEHRQPRRAAARRVHDARPHRAGRRGRRARTLAFEAHGEGRAASRTRDLGGTAGTDEFTDAVIAALA